MGLLKGTLTFSRYRLPGDLPGRFHDFIDRQIKKHAFQELSVASEEKSSGWTSLENILDTRFEQANYATGDYLAFSCRMDRKIIPPSLLKLRLLEAEKKILSRSRKYISKDQRDEIKERIRLELLGQAHPIPSFYDVCWSLSAKWLIFGSLSPKVQEEFEGLFKKTFDLPLLPLAPWDVKYIDRPMAEQVASLMGGAFLSPQGGSGDPSDPGVLGREFLTWLWFKSEERGGAVMVPGIGDLEVIFARRVVLESGEGEYAESVLCQGLHSDLKEGKAAIHEGKKIKEARIQLGKGTDQWEFTLKADRFQFQSLKLPASMNMGEETDDKEGRLLERIYLIETALKTMDQLFSFFLGRRLSPQWSTEDIPRIKKWVQK